MFGCLTFEMYLLGRQLVFTDHKPLLPLFNNPRKFVPARVERIRLRLQGFDYQVRQILVTKDILEFLIS